MKQYKVLLVDDHKIMRNGIRSFFGTYPNFKVIAEADNGHQALRALESDPVDLIFMDINMKSMDGITATREISKIYPTIKIIAFTMINEERYIKDMMNAGALGYVLKSCDSYELNKAVESVMSSEMYYCTEVAETIMASSVRKKNHSSNLSFEVPLTRREKEILTLIIEQYSNREIADKLSISIRTVESHKRNLLEKTGSKNMAGLALYAMRKNLIADL